ncbi:MAG: protein O-mannosyl-transferase family, partial [Sandaracinaceae bacterium]
MSVGLGLRDPRRAWVAAAVPAVVYGLTMARDLTVYDSPELALVAHQLGLGHPIGQPLHTLLGAVFARLPGVDPWIGVGLLSALAGALCVLPAAAVLERLEGPRPEGPARWLPAVVLSLTALHPLVADPATRVEVYSLANLAALSALAFALGPGRDRAAAFRSGLALGLAGTANAVVAAAFGLALVPVAAVRARRSGEPARVLGGAAAGLALGLLPYLYVPLVAHRTGVLVWGAPTDPEALWAYLRGADYAHNQTLGLSGWVDHGFALTAWMARRGFLPVVLGGLAGFGLRGSGGLRAVLPIALLGTGAFVAFNVVFHPDVPDYAGYLAGPYLLAGAGLGALLGRGLQAAGPLRTGAWVGVALAVLPLALPPWAWARPRARPSIARALVERAFAEAPASAVLVVEADHWVAPLLYAQHVEGARPDVVILPYGLASSRWYWELLFARHDLTPVPLVGPGGRAGRVRRLVAAEPRPLLVGTPSLADRLGVPVCGVGALLWVAPACEGAVDPTASSRAFARSTPGFGEGIEVATRVGFARGLALARHGRGGAAVGAGAGGHAPAGAQPGGPAEPAPARAGGAGGCGGAAVSALARSWPAAPAPMPAPPRPWRASA